ncbi:hypothetical protein BD414DRAFT_535912 [Trametes punicea]|nr:hypothetical protein BD414DRAFT_535912 [Trametes punicea]
MVQSSKTPQQQDQKTPEFRFRTKLVQERSIFESFAVLPARTRLYISLGLTVFAGIGLLVSDQLEKAYPAPKESPGAPKSAPQEPASSSS